NGDLCRHALPPLDGGVDVLRIKIHPVPTSPRLLGGKDGRAAATEGVHDNTAALRDVEDRVRDHRDRLDGGMIIETPRSTAHLKGVHARIVPDIRPVTPELPELHVVEPGGAVSAEDEHEIVLGTIKRSHAAG